MIPLPTAVAQENNVQCGETWKGGALPGGNVLQKSISTSTVLQANSSTVVPHSGGLNGSGINNSPKVLTSKTKRKKEISSELKNKAMSFGGRGGWAELNKRRVSPRGAPKADIQDRGPWEERKADGCHALPLYPELQA